MILNALDGKPLPVYGDGLQIRDWLYVDDHARALYEVLTKGKVGETYNIGGHNEMKNIDVVHTICDVLEDLRPDKPEGLEKYRDLITYVTDRAGHDMRYAIDATKLKEELGWVPSLQFEEGITNTIGWYLENKEWLNSITSGNYQEYYKKQYAKR